MASMQTHRRPSPRLLAVLKCGWASNKEIPLGSHGLRGIFSFLIFGFVRASGWPDWCPVCAIDVKTGAGARVSVGTGDGVSADVATGDDDTDVSESFRVALPGEQFGHACNYAMRVSYDPERRRFSYLRKANGGALMSVIVNLNKCDWSDAAKSNYANVPDADLTDVADILSAYEKSAKRYETEDASQSIADMMAGDCKPWDKPEDIGKALGRWTKTRLWQNYLTENHGECLTPDDKARCAADGANGFLNMVQSGFMRYCARIIDPGHADDVESFDGVQPLLFDFAE